VNVTSTTSLGLKFPAIDNSEPEFDSPATPMTMEQYLDLCDFMLGFSDPVAREKQKELEERIEARFRL